MKLIVLSGFLGSGKTSVLLSLAGHLNRGGRGKRILVIENEVGDVGIDDKVVARAGFEVRPLLAGCICCTIATDLVTTLNEAYALHRPDFAIFEPSGVAYPGRIADSVSRYANGIEWLRQITVIDARRWRRIHTAMPALSESQVRGAGLLLLNKCDVATEEEIVLAEQDVRRISPGTPLRRTCAREGVDWAEWEEFLE